MLAKDTTLEMKILSDKKSGFGLNEEIVGLAFASIPIDTSFETNSFEESSTKSSKFTQIVKQQKIHESNHQLTENLYMKNQNSSNIITSDSMNNQDNLHYKNYLNENIVNVISSNTNKEYSIGSNITQKNINYDSNSNNFGPIIYHEKNIKNVISLNQTNDPRTESNITVIINPNLHINEALDTNNGILLRSNKISMPLHSNKSKQQTQLTPQKHEFRLTSSPLQLIKEELTKFYLENDPQDVYEDIYYEMLNKDKERDYYIDPHYFNSIQVSINWLMRSILIDWMMEVCSEFGISRETFHYSINYVDRYLSIRFIEKWELQLVGVTSLFMASKMEVLKIYLLITKLYIGSFTTKIKRICKIC